MINNKAYKAVIFDLDGVICSTDEYHFQAWKKLADENGIEFDREKNNRLRGVSRMESLEIVLEGSGKIFTETQKEELAAQKNMVYKKLLVQMSAANLAPEVKTTLATLRKNGIKLAIGSSSRNAAYILERIGLANYFDEVADGNDIEKSKPHPEVFLLAAKKVGMKPEECLVVEDAKAGVQAAVAGGMHCAAMGDASDEAAAKYTLKKFTDLIDIVIR